MERLATAAKTERPGIIGEDSAAPVPSYWPFLAALFIADIVGAFETSMIYAAVKSIIAEFGDAGAVGWMVSIFGLVGAGCAAICGRLGDMFGRRRMLLILLTIGAVGSIVSVATSDFTLLLVGRGLQGLGAGVLPLIIGMLRQELPPERVPVAVGLMVSAAAAGTALGLVAGGLIVDHFDWRSLFIASAAVGAAAFVAVLAAARKDGAGRTRERIDWLGGALFLPGLALVLAALGNGSRWGWLDQMTWGTAGGGLLLLVFWIARSLRISDPLIDLRLLANRRVAVANLISVLVALGALQIMLIFSLMLQSPVWTGIGLGVSATVAGLVKLPSNVFAVIVAPWSGSLTQRRGDRAPILIGGLLVTAGWAGILIVHDRLLAVGTLLCAIAAGTTILFAAIPNAIVPAVPEGRTSEAIGTMSVIRAVAMSVGAQLVAALLSSSTVTRAGESGQYPDERAFYLAITVVIALTLAGTALAFALPRGD